METLKEIREKLSKQINDLLDKRKEYQDVMEQITLEATARRDAGESDDLTEDEESRFQSAKDAIRQLDSEKAPLIARRNELEAMEQEQAEAEEARRELDPDAEPRSAATSIGVTTTEQRRDGDFTYGRHNNTRRSFFADLLNWRAGTDFDAEVRLKRHATEMRNAGLSLPDRNEGEQRAVATGAFGALVVPQYLPDEFAEILHNGRAFANAVRNRPLPPEGMTVTIPRGQTGVSTASQATQNTAVSETDVDYDNDLAISVVTIAGAQTVSRQSLDRGVTGLDEILYEDLVGSYASQLDSQIISGDGTGGTHKGVLNATGINNVTYTDATPTLAELWPKYADSDSQVAAARKITGVNLRVMHTRRWGFHVADLDSQGRPTVITDPSQAVNAMGAAASRFVQGQLVGIVQGQPVLVDNNIPTNLGVGTDEDRIINLASNDPILWEEGDGMPRRVRFDQPQGLSLGVELLVFGYSAFTAERRPEGVAVIAGTGLVAPTF